MLSDVELIVNAKARVVHADSVVMHNSEKKTTTKTELPMVLRTQFLLVHSMLTFMNLGREGHFRQIQLMRMWAIGDVDYK